MAKPIRMLTKAQRIKVYRRALQSYTKHAALMNKIDKTSSFYLHLEVDGMCKHINHAVEALNLEDKTDKSSNRKAWPEYYSFKPKTTWSENPDYWFTRRIKYDGHKKRLDILQACSKGRSKTDVVAS